MDLTQCVCGQDIEEVVRGRGVPKTSILCLIYLSPDVVTMYDAMYSTYASDSRCENRIHKKHHTHQCVTRSQNELSLPQ